MGFLDYSDANMIFYRHWECEVRASGRVVFLRFDCDRPVLERDLEMSILDVGSDKFLYCTRQLEGRKNWNFHPAR